MRNHRKSQSRVDDGQTDGHSRRSLAVQAQECTEDRQATFLAAFAEVGTVQAACLTTGIGRRTIYDWCAKDEGFARQFQEAREAAGDVLEAECRRRAMEGVAEPVFYQGKIVGYMQKFSDLCLLALLKAYRPDRFKHRPEHSGKGALLTAVVHVSFDRNMKPDDM